MIHLSHVNKRAPDDYQVQFTMFSLVILPVSIVYRPGSKQKSHRDMTTLIVS